MSEFLAPFETMLDSLFPPARVRAIDDGADWSAEHIEVEASGFLDALGTEAGLPLAEVIPLWRALGYRAAPLALGEAMIDRAECDAASIRPLLLAAAISGAADRVLAMTTDYASQRQQFGKPIGRQQALQQQLAVMAQRAVAIRLAVELAASGSGWPTLDRVAVAKTTASTYAPQIANTAHAVHGAIGISAEYDLQLYTRRLHAWRLDEGGESAWAQALGRRLIDAQDNTLDWVRAALF